MDELQGVLKGQKIAYFSMEVGLTNEIPTYAGDWAHLLAMPYVLPLTLKFLLLRLR